MESYMYSQSVVEELDSKGVLNRSYDSVPLKYVLDTKEQSVRVEK